MNTLWPRCLKSLEAELSPEEVLTWLSPLHAEVDGDALKLLAPNAFVLQTVRERYQSRIEAVARHFEPSLGAVRIEVGSGAARAPRATATPVPAAREPRVTATPAVADFEGHLDPHYTFDNFVEGKSNQLGKAAALQVAMNPGRTYNPLLLYGGTGLGKTHLMHAAGNLIRANDPSTKVMYLRSEQFVSAMIDALRTKKMDDFKRRFRDVAALLIDDIQFFAGKNTTQEEFFHTFN